jgi:hypothetical protein
MHVSAFRRSRWTLPVLVLLSATLAPVAMARADRLAHVDVYDRSLGEALPVYRHQGQRFIEGHPGNEYAVRIRNQTGERVLAVLSVDGVNAVTGETASPDQSGYVIEPWGYVTVQGWRKDLDGTAAFYFTDPADSYAGRTGRPDDLGVIGVALFRERMADPVPRVSRERGEEEYPMAAEAAAPSAGAHDAGAQKRRSGEIASEARTQTQAQAQAAQSAPLGTGHGRREHAPVRRVDFERAHSRPDQVLTIRYERHETLVAMGVLDTPHEPWRAPEPFPGAMGFVPDP